MINISITIFAQTGHIESHSLHNVNENKIDLYVYNHLFNTELPLIKTISHDLLNKHYFWIFDQKTRKTVLIQKLS